MVKSMRDSLSALILAVSLIGSAWAVCPDGDLDNDCQVDFNDVKFLADHWLDGPGSPANLVGQDEVNIAEFSVIAMHWGEVGERTGSVEVEISPKAAINLGAKWRVDGGPWQDSGQRLDELVVAFNTIEFKSIDIWAKPADAEIYINGDLITAVRAAYKHPLEINEFMASNSGNARNSPEGNAKDEHGEYDDWIEIFNSGDEAIDAAGMHLRDGDDNEWEFPGNNPLTTIAPGGYLLIWADDWTDNDVNDGPLHTNFKLSAGGDKISLYDTDDESLIDSVDFGDQTNDISYGRDANDNWRFFPYPSPGWENNDAYLGAVANTKFSHNRGFYDTQFSVTIATETKGATIKYTTNGSAPSETVGQEYTGPVPIDTTKCLRAMAFKTGFKPSDVDTHTYIFLADVINQPANPPGFPSTWDGKPADYDMDPAVISRYTYAELTDALLSLPSISIVTDMDNLFDNSIGIYENPSGHGEEWERPASAEWIDHSGGPEFQVNCGLRMQGGAARTFAIKKPFRLLFKTIYGASKLEFPMFEESGNAADSFDTITLRANSQGPNYLGAKTQITDDNGRHTLLDMGTPQSHGTSVHLYVNGLYWGLYNAVERPQASFCVNYFGGVKEEWDAHNGNKAIDGTRDTWDAMIAQVQAGLANNAAYQKIQGNNPDGTPNPDFPVYLDMPDYIDYMLCNFYLGTGDWAGNENQGKRNYYCARRRIDDSTGFKWFVWDAERSLQYTNNTGVSYGPAEPYTELKGCSLNIVWFHAS